MRSAEGIRNQATPKNSTPGSGSLVQAANQTDTAIDPAEVTNTLRTKGISERQAGGIAEAIVARVNGQELTRPQRNLLNFALGSSVVRDTISDLLQKKAKGIDNARNEVYAENNISEDLANEENTALAYKRVGGDSSEVNVFGDIDYATAMEDPSFHQVQKSVSKKTHEGSFEVGFTWKLRGKDVTLNDVKVQEITYAKRNSTGLKTLRNMFNNTTRRKFLVDLGHDVGCLRNAGFSETDIKKIQNGRVPNGWQVHHKLPLDDSGTNSFDNLVLIKNEPYHKVITNYQNSIARQIKIGDIQKLEWPIPNGKIYPTQH